MRDRVRATLPFFAALGCFAVVGGTVLYLLEREHAIAHAAGVADRADLRRQAERNAQAIAGLTDATAKRDEAARRAISMIEQIAKDQAAIRRAIEGDKAQP